MNRIIVVGGGAAGMMAAIAAAENGNKVTLLEHNEKLGKKLFITGKGRCNLTNECDTQKLLENVVTNRKFLYSVCWQFDAEACMEFFEGLGVRLKVERGGRVFPKSDHSSDVIRALEYELRRLGVEILLNMDVKQILVVEKKTEQDIKAVPEEGLPERKESADVSMRNEKEKRNKDGKNEPSCAVSGVMLGDKRTLDADCVILATGGISYPLTGSDGSGLAMAGKLGHTVTGLYPALVPLIAREIWCRELMGLSLKNVQVTILQGKKKLYQDFGEMLFTHQGVSGPLILSASSLITKSLEKQELLLEIDLKPALDEQQLDRRLLRDFEKMNKKQLKNALIELLPARLIPVVIDQAELDADRPVNTISKAQRERLRFALKHLRLHIQKTADFNEAIITQGGISVKQINPSTLESKLVSGLYFAGECIDVDAFTGGYNLQIAWASGRLAGKCAACADG